MLPLSTSARYRALGLAGVGTLAVALPFAATAASAAAKDPVLSTRSALVGGHAKNVILFLGDGMGDSEITAARNYKLGAAGHLNMDTLPFTGEYTTYAVSKADPTKPEYVTDSAASGTGWATGHKTYNGAISVDPTGKPVQTILEQAHKAGFATGDVSTAEITDATPAVLASHVVDRSCQGPANMAACPANDKANGGLGSIAEQEAASGADVILGGGRARFEQVVTAGPFAGKSVVDQAKAAGYTYVTDATGLARVTPARGQKILGLFSPGNMDLEWTGQTAQPFTSATAPNAVPSKCGTNAARDAAQPHLADMTAKALAILDTKAKSAAKGKGKGSDKGFFLQVEGASIDKQDHAENPCGQIGETIAFDKAIKLGLGFAKTHPGTLVVVTADHGHTSQIVEYPQTAAHHSPGAFATLLTADGAPMVLNYATVTHGASQDHTGTEVRIAAQGPQAARVLGITNQTDLNTTFKVALGLS